MSVRRSFQILQAGLNPLQVFPAGDHLGSRGTLCTVRYRAALAGFVDLAELNGRVFEEGNPLFHLRGDQNTNCYTDVLIG